MMPLHPDIIIIGVAATENSWEEPYQGDAWQRFRTRIKYRSPLVDAHIFSVIQSSGMGKSRMIDEYSKYHLVIPMCLRDSHSSGYPRNDSEVISALGCKKHPYQTKEQSIERTQAFLLALFQVTQQYLEKLDSMTFPSDVQTVPAKFRWIMRPSMQRHKTMRETFFAEVLDKLSLQTESPDRPTPADGLKNLLACLGRLTGDTQPDILLSFDSPEVLLQPVKPEFELRPVKFGKWSHFDSLSFVFSSLRSQRVDAVLLARRPFPMGSFTHHTPFLELEYDTHAHNLLKEGCSFETASTRQFLIKFGRPLFATRYLHGDKDTRRYIVRFAANKLLAGKDLEYSKSEDIMPEDMLAILSARLPLEYDLSTLPGREASLTQVDRHMRVCIDIDESRENATTIMPSEPILAEGAAYLVRSQKIYQARQLLQLFQGSVLHKRDCGQLVGCLLLLLAKDAPSANRVKELSEFIGALLTPRWHDVVRDALPSQIRSDGEDVPLREAFSNARVYFTHFIKVHDSKVINRKKLWAAMGRGAAIVYANDQRGSFDIVIPILFGDMLQRCNISALIIRVVTDESYQENPFDPLFDIMDPYLIGLFDEDDKDLRPIIRLVFSFASRTPNVVVRDRRKTFKPFTSYDIWCAKACEDTFSVVKGQDYIYEKLVQVDRSSFYHSKSLSKELTARATDWQDADRKRKVSEDWVESPRRKMHPLAMSDARQWAFTDNSEDGGDLNDAKTQEDV